MMTVVRLVFQTKHRFQLDLCAVSDITYEDVSNHF